MPRFFFLFVIAAAAIAAPRDEQLARVKAQFPSHVVVIGELADPLVQECYSHFRERVEKMTGDNLAAELRTFRAEIDRQISDYETQLELATGNDPRARSNLTTAAKKAAVRHNLSWLKTKLRPYAVRLEGVLKGRP